jgi:hypothetical protein
MFRRLVPGIILVVRISRKAIEFSPALLRETLTVGLALVVELDGAEAPAESDAKPATLALPPLPASWQRTLDTSATARARRGSLGALNRVAGLDACAVSVPVGGLDAWVSERASPVPGKGVTATTRNRAMVCSAAWVGQDRARLQPRNRSASVTGASWTPTWTRSARTTQRSTNGGGSMRRRARASSPAPWKS